MVKDYGLICSFDKRDTGKLRRLARRLNHDEELGEQFLQCCSQRLEGNSPVLEFGNDRLEFEQVLKTDDIATLLGLNNCIDLVLGTSSNRFGTIGYGNGSAPPDVSNGALSLTMGYVNITLTSGWALAIGMKMFFGAIIGESTSSGSGIIEIGCFTGPGGTMLNRNVFANNGLSRTTGTAAIILSSVVELCPTV